MAEERPNFLMEQIRRLRTFIRAQIKWFTRLPILIVLLLAIPNPISHAVVEGVGPLIGFAEPSLATLVGVAMLFLILERVIVIEDELAKGMPLRINRRKDDVNPELADHLQHQKVSRVDIIQFSGQTMVDLLREVAKHRPRAAVRMLLCHPGRANRFDSDWQEHGQEHHAQRISSTISTVKMLEREFGQDGFKVDIRYYMAMPSLSAVILDDKLVSLSWYRCFPDAQSRDVMRIEGHNSAAVTGRGELATPLFSFGRVQFDALWDTGEDARPTTRTD
jgi:hypothetical protein